MTPRSQALRLRVFRAFNDLCEEYGMPPTAQMVADEVGIHPQVAWQHLKALRGAKGMLAAPRRPGRNYYTQHIERLAAEARRLPEPVDKIMERVG